jgi:maltose alpha-D-glucosyltransferase / alpha-amylase
MRRIFAVVANHTSDEHPWFQRARHAKPGSSWRYFMSGQKQVKDGGTRIIFVDGKRSNWTCDLGRDGLLLAPILFSSA